MPVCQIGAWWRVLESLRNDSSKHQQGKCWPKSLQKMSWEVLALSFAVFQEMFPSLYHSPLVCVCLSRWLLHSNCVGMSNILINGSGRPPFAKCCMCPESLSASGCGLRLVVLVGIWCFIDGLRCRSLRAISHCLTWHDLGHPWVDAMKGFLLDAPSAHC